LGFAIRGSLLSIHVSRVDNSDPIAAHCEHNVKVTIGRRPAERPPARLRHRVRLIHHYEKRFDEKRLLALARFHAVPGGQFGRVSIVPLEASGPREKLADIIGHTRSIYQVYTSRQARLQVLRASSRNSSCRKPFPAALSCRKIVHPSIP
jgi:hypothetical protein